MVCNDVGLLHVQGVLFFSILAMLFNNWAEFSLITVRSR